MHIFSARDPLPSGHPPFRGEQKSLPKQGRCRLCRQRGSLTTNH